jgi:hypothetical protein
LKLLGLVAVVMAATAMLATQASAALTATVATTSTLSSPSPGCQPKGLWGAYVLSTGGALAAGNYRYAVTADGTSATACPSIAVTAPTSTTIVALQWNPTPGATGYTVYRGTTDANLMQVSLSATCTSKCRAFDPGTSVPAGSPPVFAGTALPAGDHTDLSIAQTFDYGGAPNDNSDDPTTTNPSDLTPPALKTDVIRFPVGLVVDGLSSAATCKVSDAAGASLIGSPSLHGTQDPHEDTCPAGSLVGSVQALNRAPAGVSLVPGDVYLGTPVAGESWRLLIALRPLCSFHNVVIAPGSAACNGSIGTGNEIDTEFLSVTGNFVARSPGVNAIDAQVFDISAGTDQPLPKTTTVRATATGVAASNATSQLRRLTQTLFAYADQGTQLTSDDKAFVTLPYCGTTMFGSDQTTYADSSNTTASTPFTAFPTCPPPPTTTSPGGTSPATGKTKHKCKKGRKLKHGKCVKKRH